MSTKEKIATCIAFTPAPQEYIYILTYYRFVLNLSMIRFSFLRIGFNFLMIRFNILMLRLGGVCRNRPIDNKIVRSMTRSAFVLFFIR